MKKTTKTAKPAAPQVKSAPAAPAAAVPAKKAPARKPAVGKKAAPATVPAGEPVPVPPPASSSSLKPAPAPVEVVPAPTTITATFDVGFGRALYLRGEGPGLSWEQGLRMECKSADTWTITLAGLTAPAPFKVLIEDELWSLGADYLALPGTTIEITPTFH